MIVPQKICASWINKPSAISSAISVNAFPPMKTLAGLADLYLEILLDYGVIEFVTIA